MRKIVFLIFIMVLILCLINKNTNVLIPDNAIRIRIIANSNDIKDQERKYLIKNEVNEMLYSKLKGVNEYNEAKQIIKNNLDGVKQIVDNYTSDFEVNFGDNYFPEKEYKGVNYNAGNYESLVIKLGAAKGENFWCVLFPPLCMIDESKLNNVSYSFFVSELLKRLN